MKLLTLRIGLRLLLRACLCFAALCLSCPAQTGSSSPNPGAAAWPPALVLENGATVLTRKSFEEQRQTGMDTEIDWKESDALRGTDPPDEP